MKRKVLVEVMQSQTGWNLARIRQVLLVLMWESQVFHGRQDNMGSHQLSQKTKNFYLSSSAAGIKSEAWSQHNQGNNRNQHRRRLLSGKRKLQQKNENKNFDLDRSGKTSAQKNRQWITGQEPA
jgi:hypothetical protein